MRLLRIPGGVRGAYLRSNRRDLVFRRENHDGTLTIKRVNGTLTFRLEGRNNFTRATREVATRRALHERGHQREAIAEIMTRTVTHVGLNDLSEAQWIEIALRYAATLGHGDG